jgi:hypothetical protein
MERVPIQLSLPNNKSPLINLQAALQELNSTANVTDDTRWKEYERIFNSYFSFQKSNNSFTPSSQDGDEVPLTSSATNMLLSLFKEKDPSVVERVITPIYHTLPKTLQAKGLQIINFLAQTSDVQDGIYKISRKGI